MSVRHLVIAAAALLALPAAHAVNAKYAKQLEKSGCTQVTEAQGCDVTKTRAQNAKAGFAVTPEPAAKAAAKPAAKAASKPAKRAAKPAAKAASKA